MTRHFPTLSRTSRLASVLVLCPLLVAARAPAAASGPQGPSAQPARQAEAAEEGDSDATPRGAVSHFLEAARTGDFARAARYLDLASVPEGERAEEGPELARRLKVVLDRTYWIDLDALSADPAGNRDDGLHDDLERLETIEHARGGSVEILLRRAPEQNGERIWRFSSATVGRIPALYQEFGYGALGEVLPERFFVVRFLEVQLWQWIGLLVLVVLAYALSWLATWGAYSLIRPLVARSKTTLDDQLLDLTAKPVRALAAIGVFTLGLYLLRLALPVQSFLLGLQKGLVVVAVAWLFLRMIDLLMGALRARLVREGKVSAVAALPLGEKTIKVVVLAFTAVAMLQNMGFNVTGVLAGLGVGGLAIALAAQKTVENLFGGVSLILDQPVRVGDFCRFGDKTGTVEDVGLRSTKIRTLDRTVVSVPNSEFAYMQLENFARRDKIRFYAKLGLRYETTPDQMRWVLAELRRLLVSHVRVEPEPARVRFVGYGDYSLDLELFAFVNSSDINEYLGIQEDLLLRIMDIVNASGTGFAFPSSTTYLARDGGNDAELTRQAEERVRAWREERRVPLPDFAPEYKGEIDDSIEYPPRDSAVAARS